MLDRRKSGHRGWASVAVTAVYYYYYYYTFLPEVPLLYRFYYEITRRTPLPY